MKRKIYLLCFAFLSLTALPQKYLPLDSTVIWSTERMAKQGSAACVIYTYSRYYMKGYTLNNGRIWSKLFESGYSSPSGTCGQGSYPPFNDVLSGYIYNDSLNRKVYHVSNLPPNYTPVQSDLLYDFNKLVGDTFFILNSINFKIDSLDSLLFSGKYHKRYHTSAIGTSPFGSSDIAFVEGIGSSIGPFHHPTYFESDSKLLCFASPSQTMTIMNYSMYNNGYCAGLIIGIDEKEGDFVQRIYPNPFRNSLTVELPATNEIRIYDGLGHLVLKQKGLKGRTDLDTESLSPGIYLLNAQGLSRKILKE